ncbi:MAG: hypothetical protein PHY62_05900 [Gallionella sp.]|nr:hypothetical protein [Gallionella sp.]
MPRVKRVFGGLLRLALLYLLLPLLLVDLILIQTALPRLIFLWQPFAVAALIWATLFAVFAYRFGWRTLIWGGIGLAYAAVLFVSLAYSAVIAGIAFSSIALLIAFAFMAGAVSFLYRNRYSEPLLILLPTCAIAWSFIVVLYQPCLVAWVTWVAGKQNVLEVLLSVFGDVSTNAVMLAIVVAPTMAMYFLGKHAYADAYGWAKGKLANKQNKEEPV